jgi:hypothetical protein
MSWPGVQTPANAGCKKDGLHSYSLALIQAGVALPLQYGRCFRL